MGIQTFDARGPMLVDAHEIRSGDWMRDQGRLRRVETVEESAEPIAPGFLMRFHDVGDGRYATLSVPAGVTVTEAPGARRV